MNEQNNNLNNISGGNPTNQNTTPTTNESQNEALSIMENINTIQPDAVPSVNPTPAPQVQPTVNATPVQQTPVAPTTESLNTNQVEQVAQPVQQTQQTVAQPTQTVQPAQQPVAQPVQTPNVVTEEQPPINPIPIGSSDGTFGPSKPINGTADITSVGFVPAESPAPKKKSKLPLIIGLIVVVILGVVGYFVVYPYVVKTFFNDPINVYTATINGAFKNINNSINEVAHEKAIYDIELSLDSNIEVLKPYSGYKYGANFGIDPKTKNLQLGYSIKTPANIEYSAYSYIKDNKNYERYSTYRDSNGKIGLIYTGETNDQEVSNVFSSFQQLINNYNKVNNEDLNYLTNKLSQLLINSIDKGKLSKEDASITINGNTLKVTNNKYLMDLDNKKRTFKYILDELKKDDKVIEIISKLADLTEDEIKEFLDINVDDLFKDEDSSLIISIYTYGNKNAIIGYAIKDDKDEFEAHYYAKDDNFFEGYLYSITENTATGKREENKVTITGVNNADGHVITFNINGEDAIILNVKSWEKGNIEFDYTIKDEDGDYTGTIKYVKDVNDSRLKMSFDFSIKVSKDENLSISFSFAEDWSSEVANINTSANGNVVTLSETELADIRNRFNTDIMNNTPLGNLFKTVSGMYNEDINNYYSQNNVVPSENPDNNVSTDNSGTDNGVTNTNPSVPSV